MSAEAPCLVWETQGHVRFTLLDPTTLGRLPENHLSLNDPGCSSRHAAIRRQEDRWILEDLGSTNGTWVNGQRIEKVCVLKEGDRIALGGQIFVVEGLLACCLQCGGELPRGAAFCPRCGRPLEGPTPSTNTAQPAEPTVLPTSTPQPYPSIPAPDKQAILQAIASRLQALGIPCEIGTQSDLVIQAEFLDAAWGTGDRKITYTAAALLNEADRTLSLYELTQETGSGLSLGSDNEVSFQSGKTLFRKVKSVGYGTDGQAYEYTLDLGAIPKAFQDLATQYGWTFKTVLKRDKATYASPQAGRPAGTPPMTVPPAKASKVAPARKTGPLFWVLLILLSCFDLLLLVFTRGALFLGTAIAVLVLLLLLRRFVSRGVLRPLLGFSGGFLITLIGFAFALVMGSQPKTDTNAGPTITQQTGEVSVTLPIGVLPDGTRLEIQKDEQPPDSPDEPGVVFQAYDIHLPPGAELMGIAEIHLPFDKGLLPSGTAPEDAVGAAYYDEARRVWTPVSCTVDGENSRVVVYTDHFSKYAAVILKEGRRKLTQVLPAFDSPPIHFFSPEDEEKIFTEMAAGATESPTALEKGWGQFNKLYGLTGASSTVLEAVAGGETLKNVNKLMNEAGLGFAVAQLAFDISKLDNQAAVQNFTKSGAFYAVSKWGGDALGLASAGVTFMDLALNEFGEAALDKNQQKWDDAYRRYYETTPKARRSVASWYGTIARLHKESKTSSEFRDKLDREVTAHCEMFWKDAEGYAKVAESTPGMRGFGAGGEAAAGPKKISANYKAYLYQTALRGALKSYVQKVWFNETRKAEDAFNKLKAELNRVHTVTVQLQNHGAVANLQACSVRFSNPQGKVVHAQSFDASGRCELRMSLFGFMKTGGPVNLEVTVPAQGNTPPLQVRLRYQLQGLNTMITIPYTPAAETPKPAVSKPSAPPPPVVKVPPPTLPASKPVAAPAPAPAPEKKYDFEAALAKWTADHKA